MQKIVNIRLIFVENYVDKWISCQLSGRDNPYINTHLLNLDKNKLSTLINCLIVFDA